MFIYTYIFTVKYTLGYIHFSSSFLILYNFIYEVEKSQPYVVLDILRDNEARKCFGTAIKGTKVNLFFV